MKANSHDKRQPHPLFIANLCGSQQKMGAQHGAMIKEVGGWEQVMSFYPRMPEILLGGTSAKMRAAVRPLLEAGAIKLERQRGAELRGRTRAFLAGVGVNPRVSRHYQNFDVFQNIVNTLGRYRLGPFKQRFVEQAPAACSTLVSWGAASDNGSLRHARNFDFPGIGIWDTMPAVVFCSPSGGLRYGFVGMRGADVAGVSAFNEAGIVVTTHTRFHTDISWAGAGVVDLVHQIIAEARTLADAERLIRAQPVASSWGICVSSAEERRAVSFEVCGHLVRPVCPGDKEDFLAVTNRYVHPDMRSGEVTISPAFVRNSNGRYGALRRRGEEGGLDLAAMQSVLGSNEDVEVPGSERAAGGVTAQLLSVHSVVFEPENQCMYVSVGPAPTGKGPWAKVEWSWSDTPAYTMEIPSAESLTGHPAEAWGRYDTGAPSRALAAYVNASAIMGRAGDPNDAADCLSEAARLDPDDTTYQLMLGGVSMQRGQWRQSLEHFEAGLESERSTFYRGQMLLWGSRAAAVAGDGLCARRMRAELAGLSHPQLQTHKRAALDEERAPLGAKRLRKVRLSYHMADLAL